MTDRELLEAAARAAGIDAQWDCPERGMMVMAPSGNDVMTWNPLTDDGDALRLAVRLRMSVHLDSNMVDVDPDGVHWCSEDYGDDHYAATRRAIVKAAAMIGRLEK